MTARRKSPLAKTATLRRGLRVWFEIHVVEGCAKYDGCVACQHLDVLACTFDVRLGDELLAIARKYSKRALARTARG